MNAAAAAVGFLVMAAYWPGISAAAVAPRFAMISLAAVLVLSGPRIRMTAAHVAGSLFLVWSATTLAWSDLPEDGIGAMSRLLLLTAAFALGSQLTTLKPVMLAAAAGLALSSAAAIAQWFGWDGLPQIAPPAGLFYNKNYMAEVAALVAIWLIAERLWWALPAVLPALVLPVARGALLAGAAACGIMIWRRSRIGAMIGAVVALAVIVVVALSIDPRSGFERTAIWRDTFDHVSLLGYGIGSFAETFPKIAQHFVLVSSRPAQAHNEFLQVWFETGAIGLALMLALFCLLLRTPFTSGHLVITGILTEACLAFPFQMPATAFIGLLVAGHVARGGAGVFSAASDGRIPLHARV
jgi:O-antigen ligase